MRRSSKKLPKDPNQRAAEIVRLSTEEKPQEEPIKEQPPESSLLSKYFTEIGRKGGLKGGPARKKKLSKERRKAIAKKAAKARWGKNPKQ